jgi:hypothetical protein
MIQFVSWLEGANDLMKSVYSFGALSSNTDARELGSKQIQISEQPVKHIGAGNDL